MHYSPPLPAPDFSNAKDANDLMFQVLKEMQQTNYLECYYKRFERTSLIITKWNERTMQIAGEVEWNM